MSRRDAHCPICGQLSEKVLDLSFGPKMQLPVEVELRHCREDNFLFVAGGSQSDYDLYYENVANDTYHQEVAESDVRSPIAQLQSRHLIDALGKFFDVPRRVLDFGCGRASLLLELAFTFPSSQFAGFEPGPAAVTASKSAQTLGLQNLQIAGLEQCTVARPYDLIVASHVIEHVLDFDLLTLLSGLLAENGFLYIEVPNSLQYANAERREFLYYFDRLHVNHFTPQSLARLAARYGFGHAGHFDYVFPYRDGGTYPALGMLLRRGAAVVDVPSPGVLESANRYIAQEKLKAEEMARVLAEFEGVLVWGAGDNFHRSLDNGGPLSGLRQMVVLDRRPGAVKVGNTVHQTMEPAAGIRRYDWQVVVTISEARSEIGRQIAAIDPRRRVIFI